jgi:hypothetical protein
MAFKPQGIDDRIGRKQSVTVSRPNAQDWILEVNGAFSTTKVNITMALKLMPIEKAREFLAIVSTVMAKREAEENGR